MSGTGGKEWPLICFTLLSQAAVGAFWTWGAFFLVMGNTGGRGEFGFLTIPVLTAVGAVLGVAAAISFFHLGKLWRAVFVLNNLRRSWLSREILFELAFLFMIALLAFLESCGVGLPVVIVGLVALAAVIGFCFLFSMAKIYMLATVPVWRGPHTIASFFLSALLLGPLAAAAGQGSLYKYSDRTHSFQNIAAFISLSAVVLIVLMILFLTPRVGFLGVRKTTLLEYPVDRMYLYLAFRLLFLGAATLFLVAFHQKQEIGRLIYFALASAVAAEASGRRLFYAIYSRVGV
jgi:anaerobic dimethyl sulfoxide reductase subunit C